MNTLLREYQRRSMQLTSVRFSISMKGSAKRGHSTTSAIKIQTLSPIQTNRLKTTRLRLLMKMKAIRSMSTTSKS